MPKRTLLLGFVSILYNAVESLPGWCVIHCVNCISDRRKQSWQQCWLTKQNVSGMGGESSPPLQSG